MPSEPEPRGSLAEGLVQDLGMAVAIIIIIMISIATIVLLVCS